MKSHFPLSLAFGAGIFFATVANGLAQAPSPSPAAVTAQPAPTTIPSDANFKNHPEWNIRCAERVGAMIGRQCDILFIGDSITQNFVNATDATWDVADGVTVPAHPGEKGLHQSTGRLVWEKHYSGRHALNFGVGADGTEHMLWRMNSMDIWNLKPKVIVILAGTNDFKFAPEQIAEGVKAVVNKAQGMFPQAKIILVSIFPNGRAAQRMADVNQIIKTFGDDQAVFYVDVASKMIPEGSTWRGLGPDNLHLSAEGYELWATEMEPLLQKFLNASR